MNKNHDNLRAAMSRRMGPEALFMAHTLDEFESFGIDVVKITEDPIVIYLNTPEKLDYHGDSFYNKWPTSKDYLKRIQECLDDMHNGSRKITLKYKIV